MKKRLLLIAALTLLAALLIMPGAMAATTYESGARICANDSTTGLKQDDILKPGVKLYQNHGGEIIGKDNDEVWNCYITANENPSTNNEIYVGNSSRNVSPEAYSGGSGYILIKDEMFGIKASSWKVYKISQTDGVACDIYLCPAHTHNWEYKSEGNTLYAYCTVNDGCEYYKADADFASSTVKYTLPATASVVYGNAYTATPSENKIAETTGATVSVMNSTCYEDSGYSKAVNTLNAGTYYVKTEVKVTPAGDTNDPTYYLHGTQLTVTQASQPVTDVTVKNATTGKNSAEFAWNGQESIEFEITGEKESAPVTYWYYYAGRIDPKTDGLAMTNAIKAKLVEWKNDTTFTPGYYYVFARMGETDNYAETYTKGRLFHVTGNTISKTQLGVADIKGKTYGDAGGPWSIDVETPLKTKYSDIKNPVITYSYTRIVNQRGIENESGLTESPKFSDAGDYRVTYKITSDNYYEYTGTADVYIYPKKLDITLKVEDKEYDGTVDATYTVKTVEGLVGSDRIDLVGVTGEFDSSTAGERTATLGTNSLMSATIVNKGTSIVNYNYKGSVNTREMADADQKATIQPRVAEFTVLPSSFDCESISDAAQVSFTAAVSNKQGTDRDSDFNLEYTWERDKESGNFILTVTGLGNSNYALSADGVTKVTVPVNHGANATNAWTKTRTTHKRSWTCCGYTGVDEEPHEWKNGVCTECGYDCVRDGGGHTGGTANCTGRAICQYCGEHYGEYAPNNHICVNHYTKEDGAEPEYWYCIGCNRYFLDENLTVETTKDKLVIAGVDSALRVNTATTGIPQTGDEGSTNIYIALMLLSLAGMTALAVSLKKRKN